MASRLSLANSSSTGTNGDPIYFDPPVRTLTMQAWTVDGSTGASVTVLQGSLNGRNWTTINTSTNTSAATTRTSTSAHLISVARANLTAHSAGDGINVTIVGV